MQYKPYFLQTDTPCAVGLGFSTVLSKHCSMNYAYSLIDVYGTIRNCIELQKFMDFNLSDFFTSNAFYYTVSHNAQNHPMDVFTVAFYCSRLCYSGSLTALSKIARFKTFCSNIIAC